MKKVIIVSAVNLVEGGPLMVLQGCLRYLSDNLSNEYEIIVLVNRKELFAFENIKYLEFLESKKSWVNRLFYEYYYFSRLSKRLNPFLWLSLHDITPNVTADRLAVYCHNPSPFCKLLLKKTAMDLRFTLFNIFYKYLYKINIKKNNFVIVQQEWLRREFKKLYKLKNVIVAHPEACDDYFLKKGYDNSRSDGNFVFFYPAFPRVFKNFEVVCRASEKLIKIGINDFKIIFTISGKENRYAKYIYNSYKHIRQIEFLGIRNSQEICELYNMASCVIFPSKLETWGLPITEFKLFNKIILLADLGYARETLGMYDKAKFFDPNNPAQLADVMRSAIDKTIVFDKTEAIAIPDPFARNWKELFDILLRQKDNDNV